MRALRPDSEFKRCLGSSHGHERSRDDAGIHGLGAFMVSRLRFTRRNQGPKDESSLTHGMAHGMAHGRESMGRMILL